MGPRLGRVEYNRTRTDTSDDDANASMGPRLGRVEYRGQTAKRVESHTSFNGATLRTRGILLPGHRHVGGGHASMGPRLGRVEYACRTENLNAKSWCFNGATLRTRGIQLDRKLLQ